MEQVAMMLVLATVSGRAPVKVRAKDILKKQKPEQQSLWKEEKLPVAQWHQKKEKVHQRQQKLWRCQQSLQRLLKKQALRQR
jgi:hypothetical protein